MEERARARILPMASSPAQSAAPVTRGARPRALVPWAGEPSPGRLLQSPVLSRQAGWHFRSRWQRHRSRSFSPPIVTNALGRGDAALQQAIAIGGVASRQAFPPLIFPTAGCRSLGGVCQINPASGNLLLQVTPPAGNTLTLLPTLSFNSTNAASASEVGNGWSHTFKRHLAIAGSSNLEITAGDGSMFGYSSMNPTNGFYQPLVGNNPPVQNSLSSPQRLIGPFTETRPDGWAYYYPIEGGLQALINPAGNRWTVSYNTNAVPSQITDPFNRVTTLAYNSSGKLSAIQDPTGRITSFTVNSSGNLAQITTPELCVYSLVYDGSNRPTAWINPLGDRTSYSFNASNQVTSVQSPLGQVTSLTY